jgi:hypothetical protein
MSRREQVSAQQALHIVVGGIVVFLLGAGALAAAAVNHHKTKTEDAAETVSAGPVRGTPLARYVEDRTAELANARGRVTAIVSFTTYVSDADAAKRTRGLHIDRWLIAAPGGEPKDTTDVKGWRESTIRAVTGEIADFEQILPTLNQDPEFEQQTRHDLEADRKILTGLQGDAPIVFAVVVDGDAALVSKLARTAGVRLVDLAPREVARGGTVTGLRPEETVAAGDPPERPA